MVSKYELIFFGMFVFLVARYAFPVIFKYIRSRESNKKQEYDILLKEEENINVQIKELKKLYANKLAQLDFLNKELDQIFEEKLVDFRKKKEASLQIYKQSEQNKLRSEISRIEKEIIDSCMELLDAEIYAKLRRNNITCFDLGLKQLANIIEQQKNQKKD